MDNYTPIKSLSLGENSKIIKIKRKTDDKKFVCKIVNISSLSNLNELDILSRFKHPYVLKLEEYHIDEDYNLYLILPEAECDLSKYIKKYVLSLEDKIALIYKIINGMIYMYEQDYNHSDIKPSNILMINHQPKIGDFGLSFPNSVNLGYSSTTYFCSPQGLVSKYKFLAKNELFNQKLDHHKSDIFSLGILFYYILSDGENLICKKYTLSKVQQKYEKFIDKYLSILKNKKEIIINKYQKDYIKINETYTELDIQNIKNNIVLIDNLFDIIKKMINPNQQERIDLKKLISHPLFKNFNENFKIYKTIPKVIDLDKNLHNIFETYKYIFKFNNLTLNIAYNLFYKCQKLKCDFRSDLIFYCFYLANTISENRYDLEMLITLNRVFKLRDYYFNKCPKCNTDRKAEKTQCEKCNKTLICNVKKNLVIIINHVKGKIGDVEIKIRNIDNFIEIKIY